MNLLKTAFLHTTLAAAAAVIALGASLTIAAGPTAPAEKVATVSASPEHA